MTFHEFFASSFLDSYGCSSRGGQELRCVPIWITDFATPSFIRLGDYVSQTRRIFANSQAEFAKTKDEESFNSSSVGFDYAVDLN